jgi:uncharacterized DUF497 family protein
MLEQVAGFDWDEGNRDKCRKHGVTLEQIEQLFRSTPHVFPALKHSKPETRYLAIGRDAEGRHIFVAFTLRNRAGQRLIRPISARFMHAKEIAHYEAQVQND